MRVVVFNDASLSLIRIKQTGLPTDRDAVRHAPVDYAACARAFGIAGVVVEEAAGLEAAFEQPAPCLIDARIDASGYGAILESIRGPLQLPLAPPSRVPHA